jgi:hypothetical protein
VEGVISSCGGNGCRFIDAGFAASESISPEGTSVSCDEAKTGLKTDNHMRATVPAKKPLFKILKSVAPKRKSSLKEKK